MSWFDSLLRPIMVAVAWIMVQIHDLLRAIGLPSASGVTWGLSIVGLVIVIRILLIPLFVRQIKASRGMQMLSPELQAIQKKYKGRSDPASREAMTRETMELYRKHGTNPFSSCLPLLAQSPIFFALFRMLSSLDEIARGDIGNIGPMTQKVAGEAEAATIFGAPISSWFFQPDASTATKVVSVVLIILMSATTFTTQRQLTQKNMPASAMQGPMAQQQKMLLYLLPVIFAVSGVNFPIGVLIYWTTTNIWSMGQQFYVIRRNPTPGSEAERLLEARRARRRVARGLPEQEPEAEPEQPRGGGQRQQPVRKDRTRGRTPPPSGSAAAQKAGGTKPGAQKPGAQKPGAARPTATGKAGGTKPGVQKAGTAGTPGAARPSAGGKPGAARPTGTGKAGGTKPGAQKPGTGKPGAGKPGSDAGGAERPSSQRPSTGAQPRAAEPRKQTTEPEVDGEEL